VRNRRPTACGHGGGRRWSGSLVVCEQGTMRGGGRGPVRGRKSTRGVATLSPIDEQRQFLIKPIFKWIRICNGTKDVLLNKEQLFLLEHLQIQNRI
jgi:hypothetical protein